MTPAEAIAKARARLAWVAEHSDYDEDEDEVLRVLWALVEQSRHEGRMEALNAVFQINGPSRAITRLKKQYTDEHPCCTICGADHQPILCPRRLGEGGKEMKTKPLDDLELFELLRAAYPEKFKADDDETWEAAQQFADDISGWQDVADLLGRVVMLTMPMESGITKRLSHCLGTVTFSEGSVLMTAAVRRDVANPPPVAAT